MGKAITMKQRLKNSAVTAILIRRMNCCWLWTKNKWLSKARTIKQRLKNSAITATLTRRMNCCWLWAKNKWLDIIFFSLVLAIFAFLINQACGYVQNQKITHVQFLSYLLTTLAPLIAQSVALAYSERIGRVAGVLLTLVVVLFLAGKAFELQTYIR